jgi:ribosomal protein S18 acetylase RimI-like enzyme
MIRTIEELSMNAWPALQTMLWDGWVLRFANGYTRRANSVYPLYPGSGQTSPAEKIVACEKHYRAQGLPVVFKMTTACFPSELDDLLAARGYKVEAHTSLQLLSLKKWGPAPLENVSLDPQENDAWQAAFGRMSRLEGKSAAAHRQILDLILLPTRYAALEVDGQIVACGLGVLQDGFLGLYDIVTSPDFRRRGYGEQIMRALLAWAKRQGAHTAYLQVMLNNPPALKLYEKLGFNEAYRYWYRVGE